LESNFVLSHSGALLWNPNNHSSLTYEYADAPGYAIFTVDKSSVQAHFYVGLGKWRWRSLNLTALLQDQQ